MVSSIKRTITSGVATGIARRHFSSCILRQMASQRSDDVSVGPYLRQVLSLFIRHTIRYILSSACAGFYLQRYKVINFQWNRIYLVYDQRGDSIKSMHTMELFLTES